jgi:hypothetical protein
MSDLRGIDNGMAQPAKVAPFAGGNGADVRQMSRSEFGRPKVGPQGAGQGLDGTQTATGPFFQLTRADLRIPSGRSFGFPPDCFDRVPFPQIA